MAVLFGRRAAALFQGYHAEATVGSEGVTADHPRLSL